MRMGLGNRGGRQAGGEAGEGASHLWWEWGWATEEGDKQAEKLAKVLDVV